LAGGLKLLRSAADRIKVGGVISHQAPHWRLRLLKGMREKLRGQVALCCICDRAFNCQRWGSLTYIDILSTEFIDLIRCLAQGGIKRFIMVA
jgi:hypothetical protein